MIKMKKQKIPISSYKIYPLLLCICTLFMCVGYAVVNSVTLDINGTVIAKVQDGIFITDVSYVSDVSADLESSKIINAYQTMLNSNIALSNTDPNSSITYSITIYNSTDYDYYFDKVDYLSDNTTYSNEDITFKLDGISNGELLKTKEYKTFNISFYYKDNILSTNQILNSYLNFIFKTKITNGNILNINVISESDCDNFNDFTSIGGYANLYGANNGQLQYDSDGSIIMGGNNSILYKNIRNQKLFENDTSIYITIKANVTQPNNNTKYPVGLFSIGAGEGKVTMEKKIWIGLYKGYLQVYSYLSSGIYTNTTTSMIETGFVSYDVQEFNNKIFNIQIVASKAKTTKIYINGEMIIEFESGDASLDDEYIVIGDLRPMRNLKYEGNLYDYEVYNRLLTEEEILTNWKYAKSKWNIK